MRFLIGFAVVFGIMLLPAMIGFWPNRTKLQTLRSPNGRWTAELFRSDSIDRNYTVRVGGARVYASPDFSPRQDIPYRETLLWDKTGRIVILEVA
jgi:hypothetical protein